MLILKSRKGESNKLKNSTNIVLAFFCLLFEHILFFVKNPFHYCLCAQIYAHHEVS